VGSGSAVRATVAEATGSEPHATTSIARVATTPIPSRERSIEEKWPLSLLSISSNHQMAPGKAIWIAPEFWKITGLVSLFVLL
jgi:hypothetical protein